jgi:hypothetical protein
MTLTRVYLPLDAEALRALARTRELDGVPLPAHGVTDALRAAQPAGDEDELEYAALWAAADACTARGARRVVAAADVDPAWLDPAPAGGSGDVSALVVTEPVPLQRIASFHVDETGGSEDDELSWYDATELPVLLDLLATA